MRSWGTADTVIASPRVQKIGCIHFSMILTWLLVRLLQMIHRILSCNTALYIGVSELIMTLKKPVSVHTSWEPVATQGPRKQQSDVIKSERLKPAKKWKCGSEWHFVCCMICRKIKPDPSRDKRDEIWGMTPNTLTSALEGRAAMMPWFALCTGKFVHLWHLLVTTVVYVLLSRHWPLLPLSRGLKAITEMTKIRPRKFKIYPRNAWRKIC